jgi:hypothetical protein
MEADAALGFPVINEKRHTGCSLRKVLRMLLTTKATRRRMEKRPSIADTPRCTKKDSDTGSASMAMPRPRTELSR